MVVVYKTSLITWNLAKRFLNLTYISHPNMIAGAAIVPELLQKNASPENIARDVRDLLEPSRNKRVRCDLAEVREKLGGGEALDRAAKIVLKVAGCSY
jgi:lipid-A-disaccharide synthase